MSDKPPIYVVPVDPEAYGLGLFIGCLLKFWPVILVGIIIIGVISLINAGVAGIGNMVHQSDVKQIASNIEVISLRGTFDPSESYPPFRVEYQLVNHASNSSYVEIGVQLPVRWYNCDDGSDHSWLYGRSTDEGYPATAWINLQPNVPVQGVIQLDSWHGYSAGYYAAHCQYEMETPQFQILDAQ